MRLSATGRSRMLCAALAVAIGVVSSGCYLQQLFVSILVSPGGYPNYEEQTTVEVTFESLLARCASESVVESPFIELQCLYLLVATSDGELEGLATADLFSEYGLLGWIIDPLVVQIPAGIGGVSGSADGGGGPVPLDIHYANSFKSGPETVVTPEPGMQFLIIELPESLASVVTATDTREGQPFDFTLRLPAPQLPLSLKLMFTVRVDNPEGTYYLPMMPCTGDFGEIPAVEVSIAAASDAEATMLALADDYASMACDGEVYDLRTIPAPGDPGVHSLFVPGLATN